jgi:hypothetical protein
VDFRGERYVVTPAPGETDDVFALRPLLKKANRDPNPDDPYYGRQVKLDGEVLEIGPKINALIVRETEAPAEADQQEKPAKKAKKGGRGE